MYQQTDAIFTWLHLSDLHFGHGDAEHDGDQRLVIDALQKDLLGLAGKETPPLDSVLITGDVAFSGNCRQRPGASRSHEYSLAASVLNEISSTYRIGLDRVFIVPGNHDVQRSADQNRSIKRLLRDLREGAESLDEAFTHPEDLGLLAQRQANFWTFAAQLSPKYADINVSSKLWWYFRLEIRGLKVRLVGLNTALLAADEHDRGRLRLGKIPLAEAFTSPPLEQGELVIVMSHHPFRGGWLADERECDAWISSRAHIHLFGHIHEADSEETRRGAVDSFVRVAAGAVHEEKLSSGMSASHGYNIAAVVRKPSNQLALRVWPRRWRNKQKRFGPDFENLPDNSLYAEHLLRIQFVAPMTRNATAISEPCTGIESSVNPKGICLRAELNINTNKPMVLNINLSEADRKLSIDAQIQLPDQVSQWLTDFCQRIPKRANGLDVSTSKIVLRNMLASLSDKLLPLSIREILADQSWPTGTPLHIQYAGLWAPWECLWIGDSAGLQGNYLGEKFAITRWPLTMPEHNRVGQGRVLFIAPKISGLDVSTERLLLRRISNNALHELGTVKDTLQILSNEYQCGVLHFACHGNSSALFLDDGALVPEDIIPLNYRPSPVAGTLVFLNTSSAGLNHSSAWGDTDSWVERFLGAGAGAVVAPSWAITDQSAERFASEFYSALMKGQTLGEAARLARTNLPLDRDGMAYAVYAAPQARMTTTSDK